MKTTLPRIVFGLSCLAALFALLYGLFWFLTVVIDHDGRGSLAFKHFAPLFGGAFLLLAMLSGVFYSLQRQRRDLVGLILSSASFLSILGQVVAQRFVQLHGPS